MRIQNVEVPTGLELLPSCQAAPSCTTPKLRRQSGTFLKLSRFRDVDEPGGGKPLAFTQPYVPDGG